MLSRVMMVPDKTKGIVLLEKSITMEKSSSKITTKIAMAFRIITVAPLMALLALSLMFFFLDGTVTLMDYIASIICLCILPILAYPLQKYIPGFSGKGRQGQRILAMIFANLGYLLGIIYTLIFGVRGTVLILFLTYLLSGLCIILSNSLLKIKASGHACGVVGPAAACIWYFKAQPSIVILWVTLIVAMTWASIVTKRHTPLQLLGGACVSTLSLFLWILLFSII